MGARLASDIIVSAWLRRLSLDGRAGYVLRRGDATAGAILVKCATLDGRAALWARQWDFEADSEQWHCIAQAAEAEIDAQMAREAGRDPDLWLLETESRDGDPRLGAE